jgi:hypothetical protein
MRIRMVRAPAMVGKVDVLNWLAISIKLPSLSIVAVLTFSCSDLSMWTLCICDCSPRLSFRGLNSGPIGYISIRTVFGQLQ